MSARRVRLDPLTPGRRAALCACRRKAATVSRRPGIPQGELVTRADILCAGEPRAADGEPLPAVAPGSLGTGNRSSGQQRDPLISALARYVEALDARYPDGPGQLRRETLTRERRCSP